MPAPSNPAPVSGPGALSQRTDGGPSDSQPIRSLPDAAYGEQAQFRSDQAGAPMAAAPPTPPAPAGLFSSSERPDEPVTSGIASGPGDGPEAPPSDRALFAADAQAMSHLMPELMRSAALPDAPQGFVRFVRSLRNLQGA